jgi:hypothetical protein
VIYSEDPAALQAMSDLVLLQEQARSMVRVCVRLRACGCVRALPHVL